MAIVAVGVAHSSVGASHTLQGTLTLHSADGYAPGVSGCNGQNGYDDIHMGAPVTVTDEASKVIATSELGAGQRSGSDCVFPFSVNGVPDAKFYQVEVSHRGKISYPADQLAGNSWKVELSLGSS